MPRAAIRPNTGADRCVCGYKFVFMMIFLTKVHAEIRCDCQPFDGSELPCVVRPYMYSWLSSHEKLWSAKF